VLGFTAPARSLFRFSHVLPLGPLCPGRRSLPHRPRRRPPYARCGPPLPPILRGALGQHVPDAPGVSSRPTARPGREELRLKKEMFDSTHHKSVSLTFHQQRQLPEARLIPGASTRGIRAARPAQAGRAFQRSRQRAARMNGTAPPRFSHASFLLSSFSSFAVSATRWGGEFPV